ncbi:M20/M25/M40 family metallo-hydrolase [Culicoidibacter larvae]|nr:M20/M25/M40 family metallo-hydrolase [Culicoidibacter larvae]
MKKILHVLLAMVIIAGGYLGIMAYEPSSYNFDEQTMTVAEAAGEKQASVAVMMGHLKHIAFSAHPAGSVANQNVRAYLIEQIEAMGYVVREEHFTNTDPEVIAAATPDGEPLPEQLNMTNLVVEVAGTNPLATTLVMAHYDSTKHGPGAGDDGISVASILEAMRVLKANGQPQNNFVFLFTDGEELKMLGAKDYVEKHPEMAETATFVLDFEARGTGGGMIMFRTSNGNNHLLHHYVAAVSTPMATSIGSSIFDLLPNGTDLTVFLNSNYEGAMDFLMLDGVENYHAPTDNYDNIDRNSAYQYTTTISELINYFAKINDVENIENENAVYFPIFRGMQIVMPESIAKVLAITAALLAVIAIVLLIVKKTFNKRQLLWGAIALVAIILCGAVIGFVTRIVVVNIIPVRLPLFAIYTVMLIIILLAVLGILRLFGKRLNFSGFAVWYLVLLAIATIILTFLLSGASYLPIFILLPLAGGIIIYTLIAEKYKQRTKKIVAIITAAIASILVVPVLYLIFMAILTPTLFIIGTLFAGSIAGYLSIYSLE